MDVSNRAAEIFPPNRILPTQKTKTRNSEYGIPKTVIKIRDERIHFFIFGAFLYIFNVVKPKRRMDIIAHKSSSQNI